MTDPVKDAFTKVKEDIFNLQSQLHSITQVIKLFKRTLDSKDTPTDTQTDKPTHPENIPTDIQINQTQEEIQEIKRLLESLKSQISDISIGNRGVQTDRQTNQQTDRQTHNSGSSSNFERTPSPKFVQSSSFTIPEDRISKIDRAAEVIDSLDAIKKDLRYQFKKLTPQEMLVFSTIYQLEDQRFSVDYSLLASKTKLSESSIRDYIQKLILKGVPISKTKENNKRVTLSISPSLRKLASLDTIMALRGI